MPMMDGNKSLKDEIEEMDPKERTIMDMGKRNEELVDEREAILLEWKTTQILLRDAIKDLEAEVKYYKDFQEELGRWSRGMFGDGENRDLGMFAHLKKEMEELEDALYDKPVSLPKLEDEIADCTLLLFDLAHLHNIDIIKAMKKKHEINKSRKWGTVNPDGSVEHIKED